MSEKATTNSLFDDVLKLLPKRPSKLDDMNNMIDWRPVKTLLNKHMKRVANAVGKPAYPSLVMFKSLLLQRWYNLSDVGLEERLFDSLSFRRFAGFGIMDSIPDATTICRFRKEMLGAELAEKLFDVISRQLANWGQFKEGVCVDATVVSSSRRPHTTMEVIPEDRKEPDEPDVVVTHCDDTEAAWLKKGKKTYFGYKVHMASDPQTGLVVCGHVTSANRSDMKGLEKVLEKLPEGTQGSCYADKGYSSAENRNLVKRHGLEDAIMYKASRNKPLTEEERGRNKVISATRSRIEKIFGCFKRNLQFARSRYVGLVKVYQEFCLVALCYNMIRVRNLKVS